MPTVPEVTSENWGWLMAIAATTWGIALRFIIGHYVGVAKAQKAIAEKIESRLISIESRLSRIEERSLRRRKGDPR